MRQKLSNNSKNKEILLSSLWFNLKLFNISHRKIKIEYFSYFKFYTSLNFPLVSLTLPTIRGIPCFLTLS